MRRFQKPITLQVISWTPCGWISRQITYELNGENRREQRQNKQMTESINKMIKL